jgi:hypothetical protein
LAAADPALAATVAAEHVAIEERMACLEVLAERATVAGAGEARAHVHRLYLELAAFVAEYLRHQDLEERRVIAALDAAYPAEHLVALHDAIVSSIPPDEMAEWLTTMLPAMNVDDRVELLSGLQAAAPPEVFAGVTALAAGVLAPTDFAAVAGRLGINMSTSAAAAAWTPPSQHQAGDGPAAHPGCHAEPEAERTHQRLIGDDGRADRRRVTAVGCGMARRTRRRPC